MSVFLLFNFFLCKYSWCILFVECGKSVAISTKKILLALYLKRMGKNIIKLTKQPIKPQTNKQTNL